MGVAHGRSRRAAAFDSRSSCRRKGTSARAAAGVKRVWILDSSMLPLGGSLDRSSLAKPMVKQAKIAAVLSCFLLLAPFVASAAVVEQLIVVINGEPYTLSSVNSYAKSKMGRAFPTGGLDQINAPDRETLEQFITDKLME